MFCCLFPHLYLCSKLELVVFAPHIVGYLARISVQTVTTNEVLRHLEYKQRQHDQHDPQEQQQSSDKLPDVAWPYLYAFYSHLGPTK